MIPEQIDSTNLCRHGKRNVEIPEEVCTDIQEQRVGEAQRPNRQRSSVIHEIPANSLISQRLMNWLDICANLINNRRHQNSRRHIRQTINIGHKLLK